MKSQRAKNTVRRLLISIFFLECIGMTSMYSQVHEAITHYVDFQHKCFGFLSEISLFTQIFPCLIT